MISDKVVALGFLLTIVSSSSVREMLPPPTFGSTPPRILGQPGRSVQLPCPVYNLGHYTVIWRKDGLPSPITVGEYSFMGSQWSVETTNSGETTNVNLNISPFTDNEVGTYFCEIGYYGRTLRSPTIQLILVQPQALVRIQSAGEFFEGYILDLECSVSPGFPGPLRWMKDGQMLQTNQQTGLYIQQREDIGYGATSSLSISRAQLSDSGTYSCEAANPETGQFMTHEVQVVVQPGHQVEHPDPEEEFLRASGS